MKTGNLLIIQLLCMLMPICSYAQNISSGTDECAVPQQKFTLEQNKGSYFLISIIKNDTNQKMTFFPDTFNENVEINAYRFSNNVPLENIRSKAMLGVSSEVTLAPGDSYQERITLEWRFPLLKEVLKTDSVTLEWSTELISTNETHISCYHSTTKYRMVITP